MPNAVWTGSISLGMVVVPVRLYPAIRKKHVRFHELDRSGRRVRHVRVSEPEVDYEPPQPSPTFRIAESAQDRGSPSRAYEPRLEAYESTPSPEISYHEIQKGYEVAPGQLLSLSRDEVAELAPEKSRVIDVQQFVDVSAVDPIYFESRYYVVPDREWSGPFRLLRQAMKDSDRMALAWFTMRSRRYLSAIRAYDDVMLLTTMVHADEVASADFWVPDADAKPSDKELKMARLLIDTLSGPFEPERYPDEYRQRLLGAIEAKTPLQSAEEPSVPSPTRVLDLMAALEASVKAAKAARAEAEKQPKAPKRKSRGA